MLSFTKENVIIPKESIRYRIVANSNNEIDQYNKLKANEVIFPIINDIMNNSNNIIEARKNINKNILFYGAMNRMENEISAEWFIKNVMPEIKDTGAKYVIVGNKPSDELKKYESDNVIITGFVQDIQPYFSSAMCLAAPIQAGAGVKVKILEAMAMGVPVLTNNIGIEGIEVDDGIHYYHCETPEDYNGKIRYIIQNRDEAEKVAQNALKFINDNYNLKNSFKEYSEKIYSL